MEQELELELEGSQGKFLVSVESLGLGVGGQGGTMLPHGPGGRTEHMISKPKTRDLFCETELKQKADSETSSVAGCKEIGEGETEAQGGQQS